MNLKFSVDTKKFLIKLGNVRSVGDQAIPQIYQEFVKNTPIKYGNAKRSTVLQGKKITANYPYAEVLDAGRGYRDGQMRGSVQAPQGMTAPTIQYLRNYIKKQLGI